MHDDYISVQCFHTKIGPHKISSSGPCDSGRKPAEAVPRTTLAAKIGPAGPILAAKNGPLFPKSVPHAWDRFWQKSPHAPHKVALLFLNAAVYITN